MIEQPVSWYNRRFQAERDSHGGYADYPEKSVYFNIWKAAIENIDDDCPVADFGCGPGQFVNLLLKNNKKFSYGVDFSEVAVDMAKSMNKVVEDYFVVGNLLNKNVFYWNSYKVATLFEVLEHVTDDLIIISYIPSGTKVIFSVPNFLCPSHVRCFVDVNSIKERYDEYIDIDKITTFNDNQFYLVVGEKN